MEQITPLIEKVSALFGVLSLPKIYKWSFVIAKESKFLELCCVKSLAADTGAHRLE